MTGDSGIPARLHADLAAWYAANARDLPWRRPPESRDPYAVLVAEVMLQQTQVARAIPKFRQFMKAFPTLEALARASAGYVIRAWAPLGYNGRAVRLHRLAQVVVGENNGRLPQTVEGLRRLPGVGPYTAAAVACFAFGVCVAVLDTNIYRVLSRVAYGVKPPSDKRKIEALARRWLPRENPSGWHQALMDVGATLCTVARPRCHGCPLQPHCQAAPHLQDGVSRKVAEASVPYKPRQSPFAGSSRYYRGRIVDALRTLPIGASVGLADLGRSVRTGFDGGGLAEWLRALLDGLQRDGLVRLDSAEDGSLTVSLP
jgi:A/G-specific adenine glycosylase